VYSKVSNAVMETEPPCAVSGKNWVTNSGSPSASVSFATRLAPVKVAFCPGRIVTAVSGTATGASFTARMLIAMLAVSKSPSSSVAIHSIRATR
jgi:hypothetical protein